MAKNEALEQVREAVLLLAGHLQRCGCTWSTLTIDLSDDGVRVELYDTETGEERPVSLVQLIEMSDIDARPLKMVK